MGDNVEGNAYTIEDIRAAEVEKQNRDDALQREGYMLALRDVRRWGAGLTGTTLTPLERHVLDQALAVLESKAPGKAE